MLPELLSSDKEGNAHLDLLHGDSLDGPLRHRLMEESSARFYFRNTSASENRLFAHWPSAMLYPMQLQVTRSALHRKKKERNCLLLHRVDDRLDLALIGEQGPVLCNYFHTRTPEDVLYYALFALEQTGIDKETVDCYSAGPGLSDDYQALLKEYFPQYAKASSTKSAGSDLDMDSLALIERDICVS